MRRAALAIGCAIVMAAPCPALAATRYASPNGGATPGCPSGEPCALSYAITAAGPEDEVRLAAGVYQVATRIEATVPLTIRGQLPLLGVRGEPPRTKIVATPGVTPILALGKLTMSDVVIEASESEEGALVAYGSGSVLERLTLAARGDRSLALRGGDDFTLLDSVLSASGAGATGLFVQGTQPGKPVLRNDTIAAAGEESIGISLYVTAPGLANAIEAVNTIAYAATDVSAAGSPGTAASVALDHSDWDTSVGAVSGTNTQTAPPQFVSPIGDLRERPASPTVDAGLDDPANGTIDVDAHARSVFGRPTCEAPRGPAVTDIGAYELEPEPLSCPRPGTRILKAKVHRGRRRASFSFEAIGIATRFQCSLARQAPSGARRSRRKSKARFRPCASPRTYRRLRPGRYVFRVRAVGPAGTDPTPATRRFRI